MIDAAIAVADLVILPTASTAMDLERTIQTAATIPAEILRVALITRTNKQTRSYRDAMELLQSHEDLATFSTGITNREAIHHSYGFQIGRASCRERAEKSVWSGAGETS